MKNLGFYLLLTILILNLIVITVVNIGDDFDNSEIDRDMITAEG